MVRFSDMLGGNEDAAGSRATTAAPNPVPVDAIPEADSETETDDEPGDRNPEDVLDRLTQYATSARSTYPEPEPPAASQPRAEPDAEPIGDLTPVGDDLLPHGKAETRKRRRK